VNGTTLIGCTHSEAVNALRCAENEIAMMICDGFSDVAMSRDGNGVASHDQPLVLSRQSSSLAADNTHIAASVCKLKTCLCHK